MDGQLWGGGAAAAKVLGVATRQRTARAKPGLLKQLSKRAEAGSKDGFKAGVRGRRMHREGNKGTKRKEKQREFLR